MDLGGSGWIWMDLDGSEWIWVDLDIYIYIYILFLSLFVRGFHGNRVYILISLSINNIYSISFSICRYSYTAI